jgi:tetratricopeptide (TPR) repeat protein
MVAEKKVSRKELLNEPDEFITVSSRAIIYARENTRSILIAGAVAVLVVMAYVGYGQYREYRKTVAHKAFESAHRQYEMISRETTPPKGEMLDQLLAEFDKVAAQFSGSIAAEKAKLYSGHVLYMKGDYKEALDRYNKMQSTSLATGGLMPLFLYHTGMTRLALKEYEQALTIFEQLSKEVNSPYRREAYASIARVYELMGKDKEAVQAYRQYLKMFPEAPDALFMKSRISDLSAKG